MKRSFLYMMVLCAASSPAFSAEESFRYGVQTSLNSYSVDDPAGATANGSGLSLSGIALVDAGRDSRVMLNINKDSFNLPASTTNMGQDVSSFGGGASYQRMLRLSRTWKPWIGVGLGYTSVTYKDRFTYTAGGNKILYADREATDTALLLNANNEWQFNQDWDIGLQVQYAKSISDKSNTIRVGVYAVY